MKAIYPGSFDPLTLGHLDIIKRATKVFGHIEILVSANSSDKTRKLSPEVRAELIKEAIQGLPNIEVKTYGGLTVDYAKEQNCDVIIRGLRAAPDFEIELEMSQINNFLSDGLETVFLMTSPQHSFIRASRVWELVKLGGDINNLVPMNVANYLREHISEH